LGRAHQRRIAAGLKLRPCRASDLAIAGPWRVGDAGEQGLSMFGQAVAGRMTFRQHATQPLLERQQAALHGRLVYPPTPSLQRRCYPDVRPLESIAGHSS